MRNVQIFACGTYGYLHAERTDICMRNVRIFACGTYGYLHAERMDIRMQNARESLRNAREPHAERTRIACMALGHEHAFRDVIENHLTAISLIIFLTNYFDICTLYLRKNTV